MRICILENGRTPDDLIDEFGSYPKMIDKWLSPFLPEATFTYLSVVRGETLPAPDDEGFILTGSKHSTYERSPMDAGTDRPAAAAQAETNSGFRYLLRPSNHGGCVRRPERKICKGWGVGAQQYTYDIPDLPAAARPLCSIKIRFRRFRRSDHV
jgi:hypothetical protein